MQWSCPHCGVTLAVPYDTLGTGWSFSRCYKCGGFALIRRAEVNIIKVDKAPPGEKVILPEAGTDLTAGLLSEEAAQKFAKHTSKAKADKPTVRPARPTPPPAPQNLQKFDEIEQLNLLGEPFKPITEEKEINDQFRKRTLPFGIVFGALFAIASGVYLFSQGQSAYQKVKDTAYESHAPSGKQVASAMSETALPRKPIETANSAAPSNTLNETITAKVRENNTNDAAVNSNIVSPIENKLLAAQKLSHPVITDQVQESAMAPLKPTASVIPSASTTMVVQTRLKRVSLHEGPGMQFPVTGIANPDIRYVVADWKDRWFKIALNAGGALNDVGWIRNDLVQIMPSNFSGSAMPNGDPLRQ